MHSRQFREIVLAKQFGKNRLHFSFFGERQNEKDFRGKMGSEHPRNTCKTFCFAKSYGENAKLERLVLSILICCFRMFKYIYMHEGTALLWKIWRIHGYEMLLSTAWKGNRGAKGEEHCKAGFAILRNLISSFHLATMSRVKMHWDCIPFPFASKFLAQ